MARPAMKDCNLFFFDSETGGLDHSKHCMIEVAVVVTDFTGEKVLDEYCAKVLPVNPVDPQAAAINGYSTEKWAAEGIDLDKAMIKMLTMGRDAVFVSHNVPFDWGFFEAAMAKRRQRWNGSYHKIDTVALSIPLLKRGLVENVKLETMTKYFGVPHDNAHTALSDARACRGVYLKLMELYSKAFAA